MWRRPQQSGLLLRGGRRGPRHRPPLCTVLRCAVLIGVVLFAMLALNLYHIVGVYRAGLLSRAAQDAGDGLPRRYRRAAL